MARQYFTTGTAAPAITPTYAGEIFVDTTADKIYFATGTTSSADWDPLPSNLSDLTIDTDLALGGLYKIKKALGMDFQPASELTIATGAVTQTQSVHTVDTQSDAASDDLDTITIATDMSVLLLTLENAARIVTLKHGTGNLNLPDDADIVMAENTVYFLLYNGTAWNLVGSSASGGGAGSDTTAIHDDTAGEITAITEKTSMAVDDEFIIEDSADSNNKKSLKRSTLGQDIQNTQTGTTYTLVLSDASKTVTMSNASAQTLTIPLNSSVAFPTNTIINILQLGAGVTTITGDTGVTVNGVSGGSYDITAQYGGAALIKDATDTWIVVTGGESTYALLGTSGAISSDASVEFTTAGWFDGTYNKVVFDFIDILPSTDDVSFSIKGSIDGGSSYLAGTNYQSAGDGRSSAGTNLINNNTSAPSYNLVATTKIGNAANEHLSGSLAFFNPSSSNYKRLTSMVGYSDASGNICKYASAGEIKTTSAVNAVQFAMSSGNIASGEIRVYGVR